MNKNGLTHDIQILILEEKYKHIQGTDSEGFVFTW